MSDAIITVEGLGKKYSIRHQQNERYTALRDVLTDKAKRLFRRNGSNVSVSAFQCFRCSHYAIRNPKFLASPRGRE